MYIRKDLTFPWDQLKQNRNGMNVIKSNIPR